MTGRFVLTESTAGSVVHLFDGNTLLDTWSASTLGSNRDEMMLATLVDTLQRLALLESITKDLANNPIEKSHMSKGGWKERCEHCEGESEPSVVTTNPIEHLESCVWDRAKKATQ